MKIDYFAEQEQYDKTDKYSIEKYGQGMVGLTFREICLLDDSNTFVMEEENEYLISHENRKRKGGLGNLIEERYFHYEANNESEPDFKEAGVELKATPYKINKNNSLSAKERLVLNKINYINVAEESDIYKSHFWHKNQIILLVYYLYKEHVNRLDYEIKYVRLFTPKEEDMLIIKKDYLIIVNKIKAGKAHELSESDTWYLSACTKGATSSDRTKQPYSSIMAKPRAFAYKASYMTYVLNNYIIPGKPLYESLIGNKKIENLEDYIISTIDSYKGQSYEELCAKFNIDSEIKRKNIYAMLTYRMLGIKGNNAEEFVKASIQIKTIRIEKNGSIKENMSLPTFKFNEIINQEWESSDLFNMLFTTKFLFVVYQQDEEGNYRLDHAKFWNMPYDVLDSEVQKVWNKTKDSLNNLPVDLKENGQYKGIFPKQSENEVCHVRPHAQNSRDTYPLPDGREYPKQCFWLNNSYILSIVKK